MSEMIHDARKDVEAALASIEQPIYDTSGSTERSSVFTPNHAETQADISPSERAALIGALLNHVRKSVKNDYDLTA